MHTLDVWIFVAHGHDPRFVRPIRAVPMKYGNPVSFGRSEALRTHAAGWTSQMTANYGVLFKAERLGTGSDPLPGDQHIHFLKQAVLRLTFEREGG